MTSADLLRAADLASFLSWVVTYALIVRRGFLDGRSGVPLLALASGISWEILYGVVRPTPGFPFFVVPVWLAVDAAVVTQYLRFGLAGPDRLGFLVRCAAAAAGAFALQYTFARDFGDQDGAYLGFAVNVVMSLAFLDMLERRGDVRGQSMYIAVAKLAGSAIAVPHAYVLHSALRSLRVLMAIAVAADVTYAVLLHGKLRAQRIRPWARI